LGSRFHSIVKIISGGQTGVDRAALDAALIHGIDCGGWCPAGRLDESGKIPQHYPLKEMEQGSFAERTLQNVKDSDGTVIIFPGELRGGTKRTREFCESEKRAHQLIDAGRVSVDEALELIIKFVRENGIRILNVAGPRASEWTEGYNYALRVLDLFICSGGL
jgi:hypothetical protein